MGKTSYISMDGMLIGEITSGVMRNYGTDALGSVVETVLNGVEENTYAYKPYGATLAKTGTAADPSFLWNGGSGYRATTLPSAGQYVLDGHYSTSTANWISVGPSWPDGNPYGYAMENPVGYIYGLSIVPSYYSGQVGSMAGYLLVKEPTLGSITVSLTVPCDPEEEAVCKQRCHNQFKGTRCAHHIWTCTGTDVWVDGELVESDFACTCTCDKCKPAPPPLTVVDPPQKRGHYYKALGCCCLGPHTHIITYFQGPPPDCKLNSTRKDGTCLSNCVPGPCT